jgi:hypothetical protein
MEVTIAYAIDVLNELGILPVIITSAVIWIAWSLFERFTDRNNNEVDDSPLTAEEEAYWQENIDAMEEEKEHQRQMEEDFQNDYDLAMSEVFEDYSEDEAFDEIFKDD